MVKAGGVNSGQGGSVSTSGFTVNSEYLRNNGGNGYVQWADAKVAGVGGKLYVGFGADSIMKTNGNIDLGIGKDRGTGGDMWISYAQYGMGKGFAGVGGSLYLFSSKTYCLCKVNVPSGTHTKLVVSGDIVQGKTHSGVGTIEGDKTTYTFIVRKGATVNYTLTKTGYDTVNKTFKTGENVNAQTNIQTVNLQLGNKIVYTHTFKLSGAHIKLTGNFVDNNGNIYHTVEGDNSVTVKIERESNTVNYVTTKTYY